MASKRSATQLLRLCPNATVLHPRSPQIAARAFSIAAQSIQKQVQRTETTGAPARARNWAVASSPPTTQRRRISTPAEPSGSKIYSFDDILSLLATPSSRTLLIDVREPHEYTANSIPTALNLPIASQPDALLLPDEEFLDRFGFAKPPADTPLVLFCKAGVRSRAGAAIARQAGYKDVGEYPGSWLDWEKKGGPGTKSPPAPGGKGEPGL